MFSSKANYVRKELQLFVHAIESLDQWDRPPYHCSLKVEPFQKYGTKALLIAQFHGRWPKVADAVIKAEQCTDQ